MRRKSHDITPIREKAMRQFRRFPEWTATRHIEFFLKTGKAVTRRTVYRWLKEWKEAEETCA